jgi:hypothetical protein
VKLNTHNWSGQTKDYQIGICHVFAKYATLRFGLVWFMMFNATFNSISVISWLSVLLVEETGVPGKNIDLSQVTDKLSHNVSSTPRHERDSNSQRWW